MNAESLTDLALDAVIPQLLVTHKDRVIELLVSDRDWRRTLVRELLKHSRYTITSLATDDPIEFVIHDTTVAENPLSIETLEVRALPTRMVQALNVLLRDAVGPPKIHWRDVAFQTHDRQLVIRLSNNDYELLTEAYLRLCYATLDADATLEHECVAHDAELLRDDQREVVEQLIVEEVADFLVFTVSFVSPETRDNRYVRNPRIRVMINC